MFVNGLPLPTALSRVLTIVLLLINFGCCWSPNGWLANRAGMRQYAKGHYALARHKFAKAVSRDPCNPDYRHNLAMAIQRQGDVGSCERILRHNLTLDAMHQPTYHSLAQVMISQGRSSEAQEMIASWQATQPYVPEANIEMAWLQRETGNTAGAEQSLQQALRSDPAHPIALAHLGQLYQDTGRNDQAVAFYQRSLSSHWDQPEVQSRLATMLESGSMTRSALMQNSGTPMMASAPVMVTEPMVASAPVMTSGPMVAEASMIPASTDTAMAVPFGGDPQFAALEDLRANPAPRLHRRIRGRDVEPTIASYPLPNFGTNASSSPSMVGWVPAGSVGSQQSLAFHPSNSVTDQYMTSQAAIQQISPPQMAESVSTPYVSNTPGSLVPQADPAHFWQSTPQMTAEVPTVDPH